MLPICKSQLSIDEKEQKLNSLCQGYISKQKMTFTAAPLFENLVQNNEYIIFGLYGYYEIKNYSIHFLFLMLAFKVTASAKSHFLDL